MLALIMSDSDHPRQALFLMYLAEHIPAEAHRQILLDGRANMLGWTAGWHMSTEKRQDEVADRAFLIRLERELAEKGPLIEVGPFSLAKYSRICVS